MHARRPRRSFNYHNLYGRGVVGEGLLGGFSGGTTMMSTSRPFLPLFVGLVGFAVILSTSYWHFSRSYLLVRDLNQMAEEDVACGKAADGLLQSWPQSEYAELRSVGEKEWCVVVQTRVRPLSGVTYLPRVLGLLLQAIRRIGTDKVHLSVNFNVPSVEDAARSDEYTRLGFRTERMETDSPRWTKSDGKEPEWSAEKQNTDYAHAINHCLRATTAKYLLIVEDDAAPAPSLFSELDRLLPNLIHNKTKPMLMMKLYVPQNYIAEEDWVWITFVFLATTAILFLVLNNQTVRRISGGNSGKGTFMAALLCTFVLALWIWMLGRHFFNDQFDLAAKHTPGGYVATTTNVKGSAVANVYARDQAARVAEFLTSTSHSRPLDLLLDDYRREQRMAQYKMVPNGFEHFGCISSNLPKLLKRNASGELAKYCAVAGEGMGDFHAIEFYHGTACHFGTGTIKIPP